MMVYDNDQPQKSQFHPFLKLSRKDVFLIMALPKTQGYYPVSAKTLFS